MLIILTVRPVTAPGKAVGNKKLVTQVAGTELMWEITFPVGIRLGAGRGDPDARARSREAVCISGSVGSVFCTTGGFIYIGNIRIEEGIDVNSHSEGVAG